MSHSWNTPNHNSVITFSLNYWNSFSVVYSPSSAPITWTPWPQQHFPTNTHTKHHEASILWNQLPRSPIRGWQPETFLYLLYLIFFGGYQTSVWYQCHTEAVVEPLQSYNKICVNVGKTLMWQNNQNTPWRPNLLWVEREWLKSCVSNFPMPDLAWYVPLAAGLRAMALLYIGRWRLHPINK